MLDDKVKEFAKNCKVKAVFRVGNGDVTYYFITEFDKFSKFGREDIFKFQLGLKEESIDLTGVLFTVLPVENPEKYKFLGECIY